MGATGRARQAEGNVSGQGRLRGTYLILSIHVQPCPMRIQTQTCLNMSKLTTRVFSCSYPLFRCLTPYLTPSLPWAMQFQAMEMQMGTDMVLNIQVDVGTHGAFFGSWVKDQSCAAPWLLPCHCSPLTLSCSPVPVPCRSLPAAGRPRGKKGV